MNRIRRKYGQTAGVSDGIHGDPIHEEELTGYSGVSDSGLSGGEGTFKARRARGAKDGSTGAGVMTRNPMVAGVSGALDGNDDETKNGLMSNPSRPAGGGGGGGGRR